MRSSHGGQQEGASISTGCLALNASFEPLTILPVRRALRLVIERKAEVLEVDASQVFRSARREMPCPTVIRLVRYIHVPQKFRRQVTNTFLFARDRYQCQYCGRHRADLRHREFLTRDHVVPLSRGGDNSWGNCVTSCSSCNCRKGSRLPHEAGLSLRATPHEPHMVHLVWAVRRLTPLQRKYVVEFFGAGVAAVLDR